MLKVSYMDKHGNWKPLDSWYGWDFVKVWGQSVEGSEQANQGDTANRKEATQRWETGWVIWRAANRLFHKQEAGQGITDSMNDIICAIPKGMGQDEQEVEQDEPGSITLIEQGDTADTHTPWYIRPINRYHTQGAAVGILLALILWWVVW